MDYNFSPGRLVLLRNTRIKIELNRKTKPCYLGPYVVVRRTQGGLYIIAELDGSVVKHRVAAFRLIPYFPQEKLSIPVTRLVGSTVNEEEGYNRATQNDKLDYDDLSDTQLGDPDSNYH